MQDVAVAVAIGIDSDDQHQVLGLAMAPSAAEMHWRGVLESLVARGLHSVELVISDSHVAAVPIPSRAQRPNVEGPTGTCG